MRKLSAAAAVASRPGLQAELSIWGTPKAAEALAAVAPPPGVKVSMDPTGVIITGLRSRFPKKEAPVPMRDTPRNTRGRTATLSTPRTRARAAAPGPAGPTVYEP